MHILILIIHFVFPDGKLFCKQHYLYALLNEQSVYRELYFFLLQLQTIYLFVGLADMCQDIKIGSRILLDTCAKWVMRYVVFSSLIYYIKTCST